MTVVDIIMDKINRLKDEIQQEKNNKSKEMLEERVIVLEELLCELNKETKNEF